MTRSIRGRSLMVVFACLLLFACLSLIPKRALANDTYVSVENPDFTFRMFWGKEVSPGVYQTQYEAQSTITREVLTITNFPNVGTSVLTETLGSVPISNTFAYTNVDRIALKTSIELPAYLSTYNDPNCAPGIEFGIRRESFNVEFQVMNMTPNTVRLDLEQYGEQRQYEFLSHTGATFLAGSKGTATVYSDNTDEKQCTSIDFNFNRIDGDYPILVNDVFTMTEGETKVLFPLENDLNTDGTFGMNVESSLPFTTSVVSPGWWKVISPTIGTYTVTYVIKSNDWPKIKPATITLQVVPRNVVMTTDVVTVPYGSDVFVFPMENDEGYALVEVESLAVEGNAPFNYYASLESRSVVMKDVAPAGVYTFTYQVIVENQPYQGEIILKVNEGPTNEPPTQQPLQQFLFLAVVGKDS